MKKLIFIFSTLLLFLFPLLFNYATLSFFPFLSYFVIFFILFIHIVFILNSTEAKIRYKRFLISLVIFFCFWFASPYLNKYSEEIYFYAHKKTFNRVLKPPKKLIDDGLHVEFLDNNTDDFTVDGYLVHQEIGFTAIVVHGILDNSDGFLYWDERTQLPSGFLDGNLVFKEKISGNWYKFSLR
ncbi:MAG: hypothetical protein ACO3E1_12885 [Flavobacteriales bacterium]